jgi:hypothetical protein
VVKKMVDENEKRQIRPKLGLEKEYKPIVIKRHGMKKRAMKRKKNNFKD